MADDDTLVDVLQKIDEVPADLLDKIAGDWDKEETKRREIHAAANKHDLVKRASRGEVDIGETVAALAEKYRGWRAVVPLRRDPDYDAQLDALRLDELGIDTSDFRTILRIYSSEDSKISRNYPRLCKAADWIMEKTTNLTVAPFVAAAVSGGLGLVADSYHTHEQMAATLAMTVIGAGMGLVVGAMQSIGKYSSRQEAIKNARYLQSEVARAYGLPMGEAQPVPKPA